MAPATVVALRHAVGDPAVVARYWRHVRVRDAGRCWWWCGAISGRGHGRFHLADTYQGEDRRRRTFVIIAHRFGYALRHGVDALLAVTVVAHRCDNTLCQNPAHWRESDPTMNRREYVARRHVVGGALADVRGAHGRARAVRDALRDGADDHAALRAGAPELHRRQIALFPSSEPSFDALEPTPVYVGEERVAAPEAPPAQLSLFD